MFVWKPTFYLLAGLERQQNNRFQCHFPLDKIICQKNLECLIEAYKVSIFPHPSTNILGSFSALQCFLDKDYLAFHSKLPSIIVSLTSHFPRLQGLLITHDKRGHGYNRPAEIHNDLKTSFPVIFNFPLKNSDWTEAYNGHILCPYHLHLCRPLS